MRPSTFITATAVLGFAILLAACGGSGAVGRFGVPSPVEAQRADLRGAMRVERGPQGSAPNALWTPEMDSTGFLTLLERRLGEAGYLAPAGTTATYVVSAAVERLDQPLQGMSYEVTSKVRYEVRRGGDRREFPILATESASLIDHVVAARRLGIASERSIEANIRAFLTALECY
jgi:hypothetical protein